MSVTAVSVLVRQQSPSVSYEGGYGSKLDSSRWGFLGAGGPPYLELGGSAQRVLLHRESPYPDAGGPPYLEVGGSHSGSSYIEDRRTDRPTTPSVVGCLEEFD